eukprot:712063-Rhodomonas_salina.1
MDRSTFLRLAQRRVAPHLTASCHLTKSTRSSGPLSTRANMPSPAKAQRCTCATKCWSAAVAPS